jgi:hypothetical protein
MVPWSNRCQWFTGAAQVIVFPVLSVAIIAVMVLFFVTVGGCR